jgi:hypothetical protein
MTTQTKAAAWCVWAALLGACTSGQTGTATATVALAAADGGDAGASDAGTDADAPPNVAEDMAADTAPDVPPADVAPAKPPVGLPQLTYYGGQLLRAPHVVTVTFPGDPYAAKLETFAADLVTSPWWQAVSAGYCMADGSCIGPGTDGGHVVLPFAPSPSYVDDLEGESTVRAMLQGAIEAAQLPAPVTDTLYVVYFPEGVAITQSDGASVGTSCQQFGGYHYSMDFAGKTVAYAVIPECPSQGDTSTLDVTTIAASHEIIEAATDPYVSLAGPGSTAQGFMLDPYLPDYTAWALALRGAEVADLCPVEPWDPESITDFQGFAVTRSWSNQAAQAGHDPCQPAPPGQTYFNVAPSQGQTHLKLKVGESATIQLHAFADGPVPKGWQVYGTDLLGLYSGSKKPKYVSLTFGDQQSALVHAGDVVQATVTLLKNPGAVSPQGAVLLVLSTDSKVAKNRFWPIRVQAK